MVPGVGDAVLVASPFPLPPEQAARPRPITAARDRAVSFVARCAGKPTDAEPYRINGELLYQGLIGVGFTCLRPQGAFYLFPKCLEEDDHAFCKRAMKYDLLLVPGTDFGVPGYFRASYCINRDTIKRSLPLFRKLAEEYGVKPGGVMLFMVIIMVALVISGLMMSQVIESDFPCLRVNTW